MDWNAQLDGYCERLGPGFWAEPVNAVTNAAFMIVAVLLWPRTRDEALARLLAAILFAIGVGSFLFHTLATRWAAAVDVAAILLFILTYVFAANRHVWGWPVWAAALGTAAVIPWTAALTRLFAALPFFTISAYYWPVVLLILVYAALAWRRHPATARGWLLGAALLCLSLAFRSVDEGLCDRLPLGTHFLWHLLNALMLGHMIRVYLRHRQENPRPRSSGGRSSPPRPVPRALAGRGGGD
jgi:hypothetical protein